MDDHSREKGGTSVDEHTDEKKKTRPGGVEKRSVWMTTPEENIRYRQKVPKNKRSETGA